MKKLHRLQMILALGWYTLRQKDPQLRRYELFDRLVQMGGLYVKFAQLILLKVNSDRQQSSEAYAFLLKKTYDSTPFEDIDVAVTLRSELGDAAADITEISSLPVAAGSFGQVFAAVNDAIASIYSSSTQNMEELLNSRNFVRIFNSVINQGNRFGLKIEVEQPEFLRATVMFISVATSLGLKREVLQPVYVNTVNNLSEVQFPQTVNYTSPDKAVTVVAEWLEKIASKDVYLYQLLSKRISTRGFHV